MFEQKCIYLQKIFRAMKKLFLLVSLTLLFASCSTSEYIKVARNFSSQHDSLAVLVLRPDNILYTNHKSYDDLKGLEDMSPKDREALLKSKSQFLSQYNDTLINCIFVDNLIGELAKTNLDVYTIEHLDEYNKCREGKRFMVEIHQLEFDEYYDVVHDTYSEIKKNRMDGNDTLIYNKDTYINAFASNIWLDCYCPYGDTMSLLYATDRITDYHEGWFAKDHYGEIIYYSENDELTIDHIDVFLKIVAKKYANYLYDHILNGYVENVYPEVVTYPKDMSLHYDFNTKNIELVGENERFVEIKR